jgi:CheY-like chemotaxis protein
MPNILIVDDSTVDRQLAGALLTRAGDWTIEYAVNGGDALEKMRKAAFDLVLTDLLMPGINGLELVAAVRAKYPHVPVILMTSRGSEEIAARALDEGAASYVPKRLLPRRLVETVGRLLLVSRGRREPSPLLDRMTEVCCSFVLPNDSKLADMLVSHLQEQAVQMGLCDETECMRMGVALQEALANAMYHGNLQVGSECRESSHTEYHATIAKRCVESPYRDRCVRITARLTRSEAVFAIRDEGEGFDPSELPDPREAANLEKASGRGVLLMRSFMDEVRFEDCGRSVTLVKRGRRAVANGLHST